MNQIRAAEQKRGKMKILIACEESQRVTEEVRKKGHECYSCDILQTSGTHKEWHIKQDVIPLLNGNCKFKTEDGTEHYIDKWDMIIAFPPCTDLAISGRKYWKQKQADGRQEKSIQFFLEFTKCNCEKIAIENPIGIMSTKYMKPTQYIEPYQFGHEETKKTCLWLKNLKPLEPTNIVTPKECRIIKIYDQKERSKTYTGIAKAMAEQWT